MTIAATEATPGEKLAFAETLAELERRGINVDAIRDEHPETLGPQTDDELWDAVYELTGYKLPRVAVCPNHVAPFQIFADVFFERRDDVLMIGNRGGGKRCHVLERIPTPGGWTTFGDVEDGDKIFDEQGKVRTVLRAHPIEERTDAYEVIFSDGVSIVADAEHLWETWSWRLRRCGNNKKKAVREASVVTTRQIRDTLYRKHGASNEFNHSIPVAKPLILPEAELPVNPWLFGVWLGDGCTDRRSEIHTNATEAPFFVNQLRRLGADTVVKQGRSGAARRVAFSGIDFRKHLPVGGKRIPQTYLRGSIDQRRALLQGLMDTDGHITKDGKAEVTIKRPELRDDVMELLRTLGYKPSFTEKIVKPSDSSNCAKNGVKDVYGPYFRVRFQPYADEPPVRMPHKVERLKRRPERPQMSSRRQIVAVKPVDSVPMRCITVDSPSSLYLCGDGMIPTHNTTISGFLHGAKCRWRPRYSSCICGATEKQSARGYAEFQRFTQFIADEIIDSLQKKTEWVNGSETEVITGTVKGVNGPHPHFAQFDELELSTKEVFEEWLNMSQGTEEYTGQNFLSSTRKFAYGLIQEIVKEADDAKSKGEAPAWDVMIFCVFETMQNQPNCGVEDENGDLLCGCDKVVKGTWPAREGELEKPRTFASVCDGRGQKAQGFVPLRDIHRRFKSMGRRVWEAQQECLRPSSEGLVHAWWDPELYGLPKWLPRKEYGPVYRSWDWGGTNPHAVIWYQVLKVPVILEVEDEIWKLPEGAMIAFDEIYHPGGGFYGLGLEVMERTKLWHEYGYDFDVVMDFCDPAGASAKEDVARAARDHNYPAPSWRMHPVGVEISVEKHIEWGEDGLLYTVVPNCPNLVREREVYHWPDTKPGMPPPKRPVEVDDHTVDAERYYVWNYYKLSTHSNQNSESPASDMSAHPAQQMTKEKSRTPEKQIYGAQPRDSILAPEFPEGAPENDTPMIRRHRYYSVRNGHR